jgi:hypothetical protein
MQATSQAQPATQRRLPVLMPHPLPAVKVPAIHVPSLPRPVNQIVNELPRVMQQLPQKLGLAAPSLGSAGPSTTPKRSDSKPLLDYLLGP